MKQYFKVRGGNCKIWIHKLPRLLFRSRHYKSHFRRSNLSVISYVSYNLFIDLFTFSLLYYSDTITLSQRLCLFISLCYYYSYYVCFFFLPVMLIIMIIWVSHFHCVFCLIRFFSPGFFWSFGLFLKWNTYKNKDKVRIYVCIQFLFFMGYP